MRWLTIARLRLRSLVRRNDVDLELDDELQAYYDERVEQALEAGLTPEAARRAARESIGSTLRLKEECRDARRLNLVDDLTQDLRYGGRLLRRNPSFAISAALVLAIGIGATTTIFTVANGLLLRAPAGVTRPDALVDVFRTEAGNSFSGPMMSYGTYLELRQRTTTLESVYAYEYELAPVSMKATASAERIFGGLVTANYFSALGLAPAAGRLFNGSDSEQPGGSPVIVLSHRFWTRRFQGDPSIVGQTLVLNGHAFAVVGVAPAEFAGTGVLAPDVWVPTAMTDVIRPGSAPLWLQVMAGGRMKPGIALAQAAAEIETIGRALPRETWRRPGGTAGLKAVTASPVPGNMRAMLAGFLTLLMALVSLVLVITCANVSGILLARATARRREIAVRLAIGAGRARLVRQLLTETMLLFVLGGGAGLLLARLMTSLLMASLPAFPQPVTVSLPLDGNVLAFTLGLSLLAAMLSGLAPGLQASRADVVSALKDESPGPERLRLRGAFVMGQVAFSILLVVVAGLLLRALERVTFRDQGYDPRGVEVATVDLSLAGYTAATGRLFAQAVAERVRLLPGVQAATVAERIPEPNIIRGMADEGVIIPGVTPPDGRPFFMANWLVVEPGFFATLRLPLIAGRDFNGADRADAQPVVIVPQSTARRLWPDKDPLGQYVTLQTGVPSGEIARATQLLVVGVTRDVGRAGDGRNAQPLSFYAPLAQRYVPRLMILARSTQGQRLANEIRDAVAALDSDLPIIGSEPLEQQQTGPIQLQLRIAASVAASVGLIGMLIAAVGVYGVTAYAVARRTREIGIRIAMGAERADVVTMVLRQGLRLVAIGAAIGLSLAALASRMLVGLLFGLPALDPIAFGGAVLLFAAIGVAACYFPARHATRIDPMDALRYE
jgi:putative ABC transport system permease protein